MSREIDLHLKKEQAVIDYFNGNKSRTQICEDFCIPTRTILDWVAIYNKYGIAKFAKKINLCTYYNVGIAWQAKRHAEITGKCLAQYITVQYTSQQ